MENSTEVLSFVLAAYGNIGELKYLYFCIMLLWYLSICVNNAAVIMVIFLDKKLHEPMYILLCNLLANEIFATTLVYPLMMSQMFSDTHEVTLPWCFMQMCCLSTSASIEFCSLAAMAYDRYVAICCPLHYNVIMNTRRVGTITVVIWMYSFVNSMFSFSVLNKISDLLFAFVTIVIPFSLISVSYMNILAVCLNTWKENKQKTISTCTPQLVSVSNLLVGCIFHFVDSRFDVAHVPDKVRIILSVYILVCQPMVTPFMYGFNLPKIRQSCKRFLFETK